MINNKKIRKYVLCTAIISIVSILIIELLLIVLEPYIYNGFYKYDQDLGFRVRSYANGANRFGFNDRDYPLQKPPKTYRILVVGDSFCWAGGKDENYTALLENKLNVYYDNYMVDVINAGYPMTHTAEQYEMLKKYGLKYDPDLVLLGFFIGNDFTDANPQRKRIVSYDVYFDIDKRKEVICCGYPIVFKSRIIEIIKQKNTILKEYYAKKMESMINDDPAMNADIGTLTNDTFLNIERSRLEFFNKEAHKLNTFRDKIKYIYKAIDNINNLLKRRGIKFVVGIYPDEFQVNESLTRQIYSKFQLNKNDYDIELGNKILKKYLESNKIMYVDLLNEFRVEGRKRQLYLLRETHWNIDGNEVTADVLFNYLIGLIRLNKI